MSGYCLWNGFRCSIGIRCILWVAFCLSCRFSFSVFFKIFDMCRGKNIKAVMERCQLFLLHQLHSFLLLLIPCCPADFVLIADKKGHYRSQVLKIMQSESIGIALCFLQVIKDVMVKPFHQGNTFSIALHILKRHLVILIHAKQFCLP